MWLWPGDEATPSSTFSTTLKVVTHPLGRAFLLSVRFGKTFMSRSEIRAPAVPVEEARTAALTAACARRYGGPTPRSVVAPQDVVNVDVVSSYSTVSLCIPLVGCGDKAELSLDVLDL